MFAWHGLLAQGLSWLMTEGVRGAGVVVALVVVGFLVVVAHDSERKERESLPRVTEGSTHLDYRNTSWFSPDVRHPNMMETHMYCTI